MIYCRNVAGAGRGSSRVALLRISAVRCAVESGKTLFLCVFLPASSCRNLYSLSGSKAAVCKTGISQTRSVPGSELCCLWAGVQLPRDLPLIADPSGTSCFNCFLTRALVQNELSSFSLVLPSLCHFSPLPPQRYRVYPLQK